MKINSDFKKLCKDNQIPLEEGVLFGVFITFKEDVPALEQYLINKDYIDYGNFRRYQHALTETDTDKLYPRLKIDMFEGVSSDEFDEFLSILSEGGISGKGYVNNELEYSIFATVKKEDIEAYEVAKKSLGSTWSISSAAQTIINYYRNTKYAKAFAKYIGSNAFIMDYKSY